MSKVKKVSGIVDCHTHSGAIDINNYYNARFPAMHDVRSLEQLMINNNIDYAVTFPMPSSLYYNVKEYWETFTFKPSGLCDFPFAVENEYLLSEVKFFNLINILPFLSFSINDKISEQCNYIYQASQVHDVYGLKYHSKGDQNTIGDVLQKAPEFLELMKNLNIPMVYHSETSGIASPMGVFKIAEKYPEVRISLAHFAGMSVEFFKEYDEYIKSYNNIFFDTAPAIALCSRYVKCVDKSDILNLDYTNPEVVNAYFLTKYSDFALWGTDAPWTFCDSLKNKWTEYIDYKDELDLRKRLEEHGISYKESTVNRFLFG